MLPAGVVAGGRALSGPPGRALVLSLGLFGECAALMLGKSPVPAEAARAG